MSDLNLDSISSSSVPYHRIGAKLQKEDSQESTVQEQDEKSKDPKVTRMMGTVRQGDASSVWAAVSKHLEGLGGWYLEGACFLGPVPEDAHSAKYGYAKLILTQTRSRGCTSLLWRC